MKKYRLILLSLLSGILLTLSWPQDGFAGLLFIGLVPLLFLEDHISRNRERFVKFSLLLYSYPAFFTWNLLTTWWIVNSTFFGAVMAVVLNSLFLSVVLQAWSWTKKRLPGRVAGYIALVSFWIAFEYLHLNWILNWPWLSIGNGFSSYHKWVQWYEFTGTTGGTLWVLTANIMIYEGIRRSRVKVLSREHGVMEPLVRLLNLFPYFSFLRHFATSFLISRYLLIFLLWIGIPVTVSYIIYHHYKEKPDPVNFVVVQPNVDPYSEQYSLAPATVVGRIMSLAGPLLDSATDFLVAPESAIQERIWENDLATFQSLPLLRTVLDEYPSLNILIGASTFYEFPPGSRVTHTARKFTNTDGYYDAYNTAILINSSDSLQLYHKSKLTPGVEALPSFRGFKWLENFALDLGGTVGSLGTDDCRKVYATTGTVPVSPIICYESVFGEFFSEFVKNGAQVMIIITNDGWWGNSPGHRQHFGFARLRSVETRRSIARSANTGISAFIDQRGDASAVTRYWVPAAIKGTLNACSRITFYVHHGDYIARAAVCITALLIVTSVVLSIFVKKGSVISP